MWLAYELSDNNLARKLVKKLEIYKAITIEETVIFVIIMVTTTIVLMNYNNSNNDYKGSNN